MRCFPEISRWHSRPFDGIRFACIRWLAMAIGVMVPLAASAVENGTNNLDAAVSDVAWSGPVRVDAMAPCGVSEVNGSVGIAYDSTWFAEAESGDAVRLAYGRVDGTGDVVAFEGAAPCDGRFEWDGPVCTTADTFSYGR